MFSKLLESFYRAIDPWGNSVLSGESRRVRGTVKDKLKRVYLWLNRQIAIRYIPIAAEFSQTNNIFENVLEVGSGSLGLARYTKKNIVGVDIDISGPRYPNMTLIQADAGRLPFRDGEFDFVCSLDMIEHLPKEKRADAIWEVCRVTGNKAVIGVPCSKETGRWEDKVRAVYYKMLAKPRYTGWRRERFVLGNQALLEHASLGLPSEEEIRDWIKEYGLLSGFRIGIREAGNESRFVWYLGALADMKYSYLRWFMTTLGFIFLFPFIARTGFGGYYRTLFFIEKCHADNCR